MIRKSHIAKIYQLYYMCIGGADKKMMPLIRICKKCGKEFILKNIAYEKRGHEKYCSRSCSSRRKNLEEDYNYTTIQLFIPRF